MRVRIWWFRVRSSICSWFRGARLDNSLRRQEATLRAAESRVTVLHDSLQRKIRHIEELRTQMDGILEDVRSEIAESQSATREYQIQIETAQNKLRVMENGTIPALVAAHKLMIARWDAETTVHVRRQAMGSPIQE